MRPLRLPPKLANEDTRKEALRVWIDEGRLSVSLIKQFPKGKKEPVIVWSIILSDIFHHVADALVLKTKLEGTFIRNQIRLFYEETLRSGRGTKTGDIALLKRSSKELNIPELSGTENCAEIIRVFFSNGSSIVMVSVGNGLPNEESVWGNILYDLTKIIAGSLAPEAPEYLIEELSERTIKLMEDPGAEFICISEGG